ncbi:MAG: polyprenyl synthetase family protein [Clostridia bacterium]|nr:polyprenyl synthetase family protein [Clostridia bacterium]
MDYNEQYAHYLNIFNSNLNEAFLSLNHQAPNTLIDAMNYSIKDGGKRLRPVLCLAACDMLGVDLKEVKEFSVALECIHSYSLVHDDLPAMDNDDFRRGKLSTHKKFGEANAILAGDALLNFAFELALKKENFSNKDARALYILAEYAGYSGMIAGQVLDLENEQNNVYDEQKLYDIYENKTAKLITAPLLIASTLSGGKYFNELKEFGYHLGVTFQIVDDIMDVEGTLESIGKTPNKDLAEDKLTSIKVFGLDGAKEHAKKHYEKCKELLSNIDNNDFLDKLTDAMFVRKK